MKSLKKRVRDHMTRNASGVDREEGKHLRMIDFLTMDQIRECMDLGDKDKIQKQVIEPNFHTIQERIGMPCDPSYIAHAVAYAVYRAGRDTRLRESSRRS